MDHYILIFCCTFLCIMLIKISSCQQIEDGNICLKHPGKLIVANPYDCYSFYACQDGNAVKIICPNNSIFNPNLENCDSSYSDCIIEESEATFSDDTDKEDLLSEDMDADQSTSSDDNLSHTDTATAELLNSTTSPLSSSTTNYPTDATSIALSTIPPGEKPNNCETCSTPNPPYVQCPSNDTDVPSFLASDLFCDSFFLCYHGSPFEMFCPAGFHWSQEHKNCIFERESNCTDASVGNKVPKCPPNGQYFIPHAERCNLFYYCENGIRSIQQCAAFKQWDIIEKTCKLDVSAKCIKALPRSQRAKYYAL